MDKIKDRVTELLSFDVILEKRKKDNSEIFKNDFDEHIFVMRHKKTNTKKIFFILLLLTIIIGLIIFIIIYLNKAKT